MRELRILMTTRQRPNHAIQLTPKAFASRLAPFRDAFGLFATTPCRRLSLSRYAAPVKQEDGQTNDENIPFPCDVSSVVYRLHGLF
jgi:hypothetical protein